MRGARALTVLRSGEVGVGDPGRGDRGLVGEGMVARMEERRSDERDEAPRAYIAADHPTRHRVPWRVAKEVSVSA